MSLWIVVLAAFSQIVFGGMVAMGMIFLGSAETAKVLSESNNQIAVTLWFIYSISLLVSIAFLAFGYFSNGSKSYYWCLLIPWIMFVILIVFWQVSPDKSV